MLTTASQAGPPLSKMIGKLLFMAGMSTHNLQTQGPSIDSELVKAAKNLLLGSPTLAALLNS